MKKISDRLLFDLNLKSTNIINYNQYIKELMKDNSPLDLTSKSENLLTLYINGQKEEDEKFNDLPLSLDLLYDFFNEGYSLQLRFIESRHWETIVNKLHTDKTLNYLKTNVIIKNNELAPPLSIPIKNKRLLFSELYQEKLPYFAIEKMISETNFPYYENINDWKTSLEDIKYIFDTILSNENIEFKDFDFLNDETFQFKFGTIFYMGLRIDNLELAEYQKIHPNSDGFKINRFTDAENLLKQWKAEYEYNFLNNQIESHKEFSNKKIKKI